MAKTLGQLLLREIRVCGPISIDACWSRIAVFNFSRQEFADALQCLGDELLIDRFRFYEEAILECSGKGEVVKLEDVSFGRLHGQPVYEQEQKTAELKRSGTAIKSPGAISSNLNEEKLMAENAIRKTSMTDRILSAVTGRPGLSCKELAVELGITSEDKSAYNTMSSILSQLDLKRGLIHRIKEGKETLVFPGKAAGAEPQAPLAQTAPDGESPEDKTTVRLIATPEEEQVTIQEARENGETQLLPSGGETADPAPEQPSRFRVAWTSDNTIILWGVAPEAVELTAEESLVLADLVALAHMRVVYKERG